MTTATQFVLTKSIKSAASGRERDILRELGIQWDGRSKHIRCPYADHDDEHASWRWNDAKGRAHCTCTASASIIDVVCKTKGIDFEKAKIWIAETIGRPDLIIRANGEKYQRTDAVSLLVPSSENRDDTLPWIYLGHRLGIEPERVLRPTTKVVGVKSLAYFDPPPRRDGKPVHVGDFAAAVFETVDRDGKTHAHRIYLAPGGAGKAELGIGPNGQRREPKKSARKTADERTAGRGVVWGDPSTAELELICEGIETAAAIALAFGTDIANGKMVIVACITAGGLEAFKPWQSAKRIIVGADRDEASNDGRQSTRRGEIAAQKFAALNHGNISVSIALPGKSGEKLDWLDLLRRDGIEAVRSGILEAVPFQPDRGAAKEERSNGKGAKQADIAIKLARENDELFHAADGTAFADVRVENHRETWAVRSRGFKLWLTRLYYQTCHGAPNSDAMQCALNALEAIARFDGPEHQVGLRVAGANDKIYIDLGSQDWSAVEIDAEGWRIVTEPPVRFRRTKGMLALPLPIRGGDVNALRPFLNVNDNKAFVLIVAWLIAALRNRGPYPILVLTGEHGTAKSTLTRILRALCDPNSVPLRSLPRDDRDLFIAASNGHLLGYDNVSVLPLWLSDSLCRLATEGGFGTRKLYTDDEEALFHAMRPIILNGIEDFVTRGDLADRSVVLMLAEIPDNRRRDEETFWAEFEGATPLIFGALLDAVAFGLGTLPEVKLDRTPRMADFAKWIVACEGGLPWKKGTFITAYEGNRSEALETLLESDTIAGAIRDLLTTKPNWDGTAGNLLKAVNATATEETRKAKDWPKTPRGMSGALRRAAPGLRKLGYTVDLDARTPDKKRTRVIRLAAPVGPMQRPSGPSKPSERPADRPCDADGGIATPRQSSEQSSAWNPSTSSALDGSDDADGRMQTIEEEASEWTV
jgi:Toprim domain-containing protein